MINLENSEVDIMRRDLANEEIQSNDFVLKADDGSEETLMEVTPVAGGSSPQWYTYKGDQQYKYKKLYQCNHRVYKEQEPGETATRDHDEHVGYIVTRYEMGLEVEPDQEYPKSYFLIKGEDLEELS